MIVPEPPIHFQTTLYPHRSLPRNGFVAVMIVLIMATLIVGGISLLRGAWPVLAFGGLEVVLVALAFRLSYRSARICETLSLTDRALVIRRSSAGQPDQCWAFQPYWLRVLMDDSPESDSRLVLTSHGRSLVIGAFLPPAQRADLARSLRAALARHRHARNPSPDSTPR
ncbi:MAG: DUF2244 domain-containing protein [Azospirillaceae bacterium]|nr:DUF2244 domain-containing protein [Azospirillaceae bacterium]